MDCSSPGSSVHGILQARILEWVAIPFCRDLPNQGIRLGSSALQADSLPSEPPGKSSVTMVIIRKTRDVEEGQSKCTVDGFVNWYSLYGRQYGGSSKI